MWRETQKQFAAALRDPGSPLPEAISNTNGRTSLKRFNVYRNNVAVGLIDALADTYPVVQALVGDDFFKSIARNFTRLFLPGSPVLLNYGEDFADFIATQSETAPTPYLSDVARLEWAWNRAYHAADKAPIGIADLADNPEGTVAHLSLQFHPSVQFLKSDWPIVSIWQAHQEKDPQNLLGQLPDRGEQALVVRPKMTVQTRVLDPVAYAFIKALYDGHTLGQASPLVIDTGPLDLSGHLAALFETGAIVGFSDLT